jgi:hypothetical protein
MATFILQSLGLIKHPLSFVDEHGVEHKMVRPQPKWITALRAPQENLKIKKAEFVVKNAYGKPGAYIDNPEMFNEWIEECTSNKISLQSVHEILTSKVDPQLGFPKHYNNKPMHYAARHGNVIMGHMLLRAGAVVEARNGLGQTPVMLAASGRFSHHSSMLRFLVDHGADVNAKDRGGNTALVLAVIAGNITNVGILLHHKAKVVDAPHEVLTYGDPEALGIARYLRAADNHFEDIDDCEEYIELQKILGASLYDRFFGFGICAKSHYIVDMLERAAENKFVSYYEIHLRNAKVGLWWFYQRVILGKKPPPVVHVIQRKVLQIQMADPSNIDAMQEKTRLARLRRKELEMKRVMVNNMEAARKEVAAVESIVELKKLYNKRAVGTWQKRENWASSVGRGQEKDEKQEALDALDEEDRRKGKKVVSRGNKSGNSAPSEGKSRWVLEPVYADKSMGVGLDSAKFLALGSKEHHTTEEDAELEAVNRLAAKLKEIEGKKIWELKHHVRDFGINISNVPKEKEDEGLVIKHGHVSVPVASLTKENLDAHTLTGKEARDAESEARRKMEEGTVGGILKEGMSGALGAFLKKKIKDEKKEKKREKKERKKLKQSRKKPESDSGDDDSDLDSEDAVVEVIKKEKTASKPKKEKKSKREKA